MAVREGAEEEAAEREGKMSENEMGNKKLLERLKLGSEVGRPVQRRQMQNTDGHGCHLSPFRV